MWAKCDMLATVALNRLDRVKTGHRTYQVFQIGRADLAAIMTAIRAALGIP